MSRAQLLRLSMIGVAFAAVLAVGFFTPSSPMRATETVDSIITASVDPAAVAKPSTTSAEFLEALQLLASGDEVGAYAGAKSLPDDTERRTIQWAAIYYGGGAIDAASVRRFMEDAPAFATSAVIKTRLEQALIREQAGPSDIIKALSGAMPNTVDAQIALALAYVGDGQKDRAARIARSIWVDNFLDKAGEEKVLNKLGSLLNHEAHWARAVHLMMHDRAQAVRRLLPHLSAPEKSLALARIAVSRNAKDAKKLLDAVDPSMQKHPVFLFSRAQRARQFELWDDAISWLNRADGTPPDAEEFWYERRALIRQLLAQDDYNRAYRAASTYTHGPEGRLVEARFHAGWIALSFLKDSKAAVQQFQAMRELSTLPDSASQALYWLGRAKLAAGDKLGSNEAYMAAARYNTIYYGLLARAELGMKNVELRQLPAWQSSEANFNSRELVRAVHLLADNGQKSKAVPLLRSFANGLKDGGELLLAARLAQSLDAHHVAILIADTAERKGVPLDLFSFPKDGLPAQHLASVDPAAVYAIARQESRFQVDAVSSSGARGLMQLMPATAKETAKKLGLSYSAGRLTSDPAYNALLGSSYLAAQLKRFEGSLVLAAAAYNAGGGNANKWIEKFGDPRSSKTDAVVWVEQIPFQETRKYVQRVLGNYLVYRSRLGSTLR